MRRIRLINVSTVFDGVDDSAPDRARNNSRIYASVISNDIYRRSAPKALPPARLFNRQETLARIIDHYYLWHWLIIMREEIWRRTGAK